MSLLPIPRPERAEGTVRGVLKEKDAQGNFKIETRPGIVEAGVITDIVELDTARRCRRTDSSTGRVEIGL